MPLPRPVTAGGVPGPREVVIVSGDLDLDAMLQRFKERAQAVRDRSLPPIGGEERLRFIEHAQLDFQDFAIIGDAEASLEDGILTLRVDLSGGDGD